LVEINPGLALPILRRYFPSTDEGDEFVAKGLVEETPQNGLHDDIDAVSNMFTQLAKFCDDTQKATG
jgi:hypothetical protein